MKKHGGFLWWLCFALVVIGALNWGLVGFFSFDLVNYLFVELWPVPVVATVVYDAVGIAAVLLLILVLTCGKKCCKCE